MELRPHGQALDWRIDRVEPFELVVTSAITFTGLQSHGLFHYKDTHSKDSCSLDTRLGVFNVFLNATEAHPHPRFPM